MVENHSIPSIKCRYLSIASLTLPTRKSAETSRANSSRCSRPSWPSVIASSTISFAVAQSISIFSNSTIFNSSIFSESSGEYCSPSTSISTTVAPVPLSDSSTASTTSDKLVSELIPSNSRDFPLRKISNAAPS